MQRPKTTLVLMSLALALALALSCSVQARYTSKPASVIHSQTQSDLSVSPNGHFLVTRDGKPFFWLGDTAWELIHGTTLEEASYYLHTRQHQGFTVIQTVVLAEADGLHRPTPEGLTPFLGDDPTKPNPDYFDKVEAIVAEADKLGLYVALVPSWGDKMTAPWGDGPRIFTTGNLPAARSYGHYLAARLRSHHNVIWLLGGDRPAHVAGMHNSYLEAMAAKAGFAPDVDWTPIWAAIAEGIHAGSDNKPLIVFHPQGGPDSTSVQLPNAPWLDVNGMQSGHGGGHDVPVWSWVERDFAVMPAKPTIDLEVNYEDHPYDPWPRWDPSTGYFNDYDVRKQTYRSVFAGGAGVTYGHHSVWGFVGSRNDVINHATMDWMSALQRPGGRQMQYLKDLILSRPSLNRTEDLTLISSGQGQEGRDHLEAMRDEAASYAFIYFPENDHTTRIDLSRLKAKTIKAWWYDPRTGIGSLIGTYEGGTLQDFRSPPNGPDWVLVVEDASKNYAPPGLERFED